MQVRDLITELQKYHPNYEVKTETVLMTNGACPECGESRGQCPIEGNVESVNIAEARCEVVINWI